MGRVAASLSFRNELLKQHEEATLFDLESIQGFEQQIADAESRGYDKAREEFEATLEAKVAKAVEAAAPRTAAFVTGEVPKGLHEDNERLYRARGSFTEFYGKLLIHLQMMGRKIKTGGYTQNEMTDAGFLMRETAKVMNELRKELEAKQALAGLTICGAQVALNLQDMNAGLNTNGILATGLCRTKQQAKLPKAGSPEYFQLCGHFGVSEELAARGVVRFSFNDLSEYLTERAEEALSLPEGLTRTYPVFTTTFRTKNRKTS